MRGRIILIDVNNIGYGAMYQPSLAGLSHNGESTSALHGVPMSVMSVLRRHPGAVPFVLWDGHSQWRYDLLPEYKAPRKDDEEKRALRADYRRQADHLRLILADLGIPQVSCPHSEADDLAGHICRHLRDDVEVLLYTSDNDWLQAISPTVSRENVRDGAVVTLEGFRRATEKYGGFDDPSLFLLCKAMEGDKSDAIPGIERIGMKTAIKSLRKYGGLDALYAAVDSGKAGSDKTARRIADGREVTDRNLLLMDWRKAPPPSPWASSILAARIPDPGIYERFGLERLARSAGSFSLDGRPVTEMVREVERALYLAVCEQDDPSMAEEPDAKREMSG